MSQGDSTRDAILDAAIAEFAERGRDGMRMEHVAKRAGCNKALVYRYFGDRDGLFDAALARRFSGRGDLLQALPDGFAEILEFWAKQSHSDPTFMKMVLREALELRDDPAPHGEYRKAYYREQIKMIERLQSEGQLDPDFDSKMLFIALLSVVTFTTAIPQIVELATGMNPEKRTFRRRWQVFLRQLAKKLL